MQVVTATTQEVAQVAVEAVKEAKKSTGTFGFGQIGNMTPNWAQWAFRIFFYGSQIVTLYLTMMSKLPAETKLEVLGWLAFLSMVVHILSRMVGVDSKKIEQEAKEAVINAQPIK
jgi:hypothetical protein